MPDYIDRFKFKKSDFVIRDAKNFWVRILTKISLIQKFVAQRVKKDKKIKIYLPGGNFLGRCQSYTTFIVIIVRQIITNHIFYLQFKRKSDKNNVNIEFFFILRSFYILYKRNSSYYKSLLYIRYYKSIHHFTYMWRTN